MTAVRMNFTRSAIDRIQPAEKRSFYRDTREPKLGLYVTPAGVKTFYAVVRAGGMTRQIPVGRFPDLSIPLARNKVTKTIAQVAATGINPVDLKRERKASSITLIEVLDTYIREKDLKPGTEKDYRRAINETFGDWLNRPLSSITEKVVLTQYQKRGKVSKARTDNAARVLRAVFNFARARYKTGRGQSQFPLNPVDIVKDTKTRFRIERRQRVISQSDLPRWWNAVNELDSPIVRDYFLLLLLTGSRREELARLTWRDVNLADRAFTLRDTKNRLDVTLPLPATLIGLLSERRSDDPDSLVFQLTPDSSGPFDPRKWITRIRKASGVEFSPHDCRRTFITIAESLDISAYTVKALVNHKTGNDVTAGYVIQTAERLQSASRRIEERILQLAGHHTGNVIQLPTAV
jgi:integrase